MFSHNFWHLKTFVFLPKIYPSTGIYRAIARCQLMCQLPQEIGKKNMKCGSGFKELKFAHLFTYSFIQLMFIKHLLCARYIIQLRPNKHSSYISEQCSRRSEIEESLQEEVAGRAKMSNLPHSSKYSGGFFHF